MSKVRHDQKSLCSYLKDRGVIWEEVEAEHDARPAGPGRDSYAHATEPVQCSGMIGTKAALLRTVNRSEHSDRCRTRTRHPSGRCPKHRSQS